MKKLMVLIKGVLISLSFFSFSVLVFADSVPKTLNIQGRVTTDSGQPLSGESYSMTLTMYDKSGNKITLSPEVTASGTLDDEGLYNQNLDISSFFSDGRTFNDEYKFDVKIVANGKTITSDKTSFATSPSAFYASTSTYAKILDPNQTEKLVNNNFYPTSIYKINVDTAVAISTQTYTSGNSFVWGINSSGVQSWTNPDIPVSTATWAINLDTANKLTSSHFNPSIIYNIKVDTATYAVNATTATYVLGSGLADGSVTTPKIADANVTPAKLTQSDYANVYKIKVDTATYAINAATATYVLGAGLPDGSVTTPKIADANVTPAKLTQSDYANVYKIKVDTATYAINAAAAVNATTATYVLGSGLADGSVTTAKIADANVTAVKIQNYAVTAIKIAADSVTPEKLQEGDATLYNIVVSTANALDSSFKLSDGNFSSGHVYTATATYATSAGTAATASGISDGIVTTAKIVDANVTPAKLTQFDYANVYKIKVDTATYATSAGTAETASNLSNGIIESSHFRYAGDYGHIYDIKVSSAGYADAPGADLAEIYASSEILEAGDVVSISATKDNSIEKTKVSDDVMVAGVISTEPGLLMNVKEKGYKLALVGKVPTKVCNEGGSIKRGDLLVSSSTAGYAKKAGEQPKAGTVIGKALENFDSSKGTILVLVNLQ
ncbi:MAG: hypothetical protein VB017_03260 [Endomicrobiaceae bacterium]|nr:hypothetical protein [Endomicrobiaceae bacterium]